MAIVDVNCAVGCPIPVAQVEVEEGLLPPQGGEICEGCGIAAAAVRLAEQAARLTKRLAVLKGLALLSDIDISAHLNPALCAAEQVDRIEQEVGFR